jgi:16S rRNA processing protein RimM
MVTQSNIIAVGEIVKAHGIKGEVVIRPMTQSANRFQKLRRALVGQTAQDVRSIDVQYVRVGSRGVRVKFVDIDDRTSAERLRGELLFVDEQHRIRIPRGTYFIHDVIGLHVIDQEERLLGVVKDVLQLPAHDVYVVDGKDREIMVPAVKEFIKSIDLETRTMKVRLIDGMLD